MIWSFKFFNCTQLDLKLDFMQLNPIKNSISTLASRDFLIWSFGSRFSRFNPQSTNKLSIRSISPLHKKSIFEILFFET